MNPLVLVIDENPQTPTLLLGTAPLTGQRFDVRAARDGVRAIRALSERMPDLLVLSAELPGKMPWDDVIQTLRKAGCRSPVILLTGAEPVDERRAFDLGVREVLGKPVNAPTLRQSLTNALEDVQYQQIGDPTTTNEIADPGDTPRLSPEFEVLHSVGTLVTSITNTNELLLRVVEAAVYITEADQGNLMVWDKESGQLTTRAAKHDNDQLARTFRMNVDDPLAKQANESGRIISVVNDEMTKIRTGLLVHAAIYVPMKVAETKIGVLMVNNMFTRRSFSDRQTRLLQAVADYAAIAIHNSRLMQNLHDRNEALETALHQVREADQLKANIIHNMSHELRTPLVFIKGYIDMLHDGELGMIPEDIRHGLKKVQKRVNDLVKIIGNAVVLQESRLVPVDGEIITIAGVIRRAMAEIDNLATQANVTIVTDLSDEELLVDGDSKLLEQVLYNLLDNAVKFSPNGGLVTIDARPLGEQHIEVSINDAGVGIPPEKLKNIFDAFYQVDGSSTRRFEGAGLGLSAANQIVLAHGGTMHVESELGKGTVFRFTLKRAGVTVESEV